MNIVQLAEFGIVVLIISQRRQGEVCWGSVKYKNQNKKKIFEVKKKSRRYDSILQQIIK